MYQAVPPPSPPWDGSHILVPYKIFPLLPVVWWGCGTVPLPPLVWWVWYHMLGIYGLYGRSGMVYLENIVCWVYMVGMVCMV